MLPSGVEIRPATWEDLVLLIPRLRKADVQECEALFGPGSIGPIVRQTFDHSILRHVAVEGHVVIAAFGVAAQSILSGVGYPWMFGTPAMEGHGRSLVTESQRYIADMLEIFPRLENVVDARNKKSIRWLKRMGFIVKPAVPVGPRGVPFHPFEMEV